MVTPYRSESFSKVFGHSLSHSNKYQITCLTTRVKPTTVFKFYTFYWHQCSTKVIVKLFLDTSAIKLVVFTSIWVIKSTRFLKFLQLTNGVTSLRTKILLTLVPEASSPFLTLCISYGSLVHNGFATLRKHKQILCVFLS